MWKTALALIIALLVLPALAWSLDTKPDLLQIQLIKMTYFLCIALALLCFFISTVTNNYSQVDKLWSIMPIAYIWIIFAYAPDPRIFVMAILITLWGLRLSYNFYRRGGYSWKFWEGEEDYRWSVLMAKLEFQAPWKWVLFNLFFISLYQMSLVWLITTPAIRSTGGGLLSWWDSLLVLFAIAFLVYETIADQQQWNYQKEKWRRINNSIPLGEEYEKGFAHKGLWALSRHPNYFGEQAFWSVIYLFSVSASGVWVNWSVAGIILLVFLFKGSSDFSESISASKYPDYSNYQDKTPRFIPFPKRKK